MTFPIYIYITLTLNPNMEKKKYSAQRSFYTFFPSFILKLLYTNDAILRDRIEKTACQLLFSFQLIGLYLIYFLFFLLIIEIESYNFPKKIILILSDFWHVNFLKIKKIIFITFFKYKLKCPSPALIVGDYLMYIYYKPFVNKCLIIKNIYIIELN